MRSKGNADNVRQRGGYTAGRGCGGGMRERGGGMEGGCNE